MNVATHAGPAACISRFDAAAADAEAIMIPPDIAIGDVNLALDEVIAKLHRLPGGNELLIVGHRLRFLRSALAYIDERDGGRS